MDIAPAPLVRQPGTDAPHRRDERIEPLHAMVESDAPPKSHRKNLPESTRRSTSPTQSQNENRCEEALGQPVDDELRQTVRGPAQERADREHRDADDEIAL